MEYCNVKVNLDKCIDIIDRANELVEKNEFKQAEQVLQEIANVQLKVKVIPIFSGSYHALQVDA